MAQTDFFRSFSHSKVQISYFLLWGILQLTRFWSGVTVQPYFAHTTKNYNIYNFCAIDRQTKPIEYRKAVKIQHNPKPRVALLKHSHIFLWMDFSHWGLPRLRSKCTKRACSVRPNLFECHVNKSENLWPKPTTCMVYREQLSLRGWIKCISTTHWRSRCIRSLILSSHVVAGQRGLTVASVRLSHQLLQSNIVRKWNLQRENIAHLTTMWNRCFLQVSFLYGTRNVADSIQMRLWFHSDPANTLTSNQLYALKQFLAIRECQDFPVLYRASETGRRHVKRDTIDKQLSSLVRERYVCR
jgi:hypothetical protein